jgi:hypothetical protein
MRGHHSDQAQVLALPYDVGSVRQCAGGGSVAGKQGKLSGATGVDVGGSLFDVSILDGSCTGLFLGCDATEDFVFTTLGDATVAAQA